MSNEEDARLRAAAASDPDNPEWTEEDFARARPAREVLSPRLYERLTGHKLGGSGPDEASTKRLVSLPLDLDIIEHLKAQGPDWQTRLNDALRAIIDVGKAA